MKDFQEFQRKIHKHKKHKGAQAMIIKDDNKWYNLTEASILTGLHKNTIRGYVKIGKVEAKKENGKYGLETIISHNSLVKAGITIDDKDKNALLWDGKVKSIGRDNISGDGMPNVNGFTEDKKNPYIPSNFYKEIMLKYEQATYRTGWLEGQLETTKRLLTEGQEAIRQREESLIKERVKIEERLKHEEEEKENLEQEILKIKEETERIKKEKEELTRILLFKNTPWWKKAFYTKERIEKEIEEEINKKRR